MSYLMYLIPEACERTVEFEPLSPLNTYPILPSSRGELSKTLQGKKGYPLMANYALASKVNKLYDLLTEIEEMNTSDEDVEWYVGCMRDNLHGLTSIVEDYQHVREAA